MRDENAEIERIWKGGHLAGAAVTLLLVWVSLVYGIVHFSPHKLTIINTGSATVLILEK